MKKYLIITFFLIIFFNQSAADQIPSYFARVGKSAFGDLTKTVTEAPLIYKNMFAVPFSKVKLKNTGLQIGFLATSFLFDESFNTISRDTIEPNCNTHVRHIRLPFPIIRFGDKVKPIFSAPNSFHYDFVFLTFAQYGYLFSLFTENDRFRHLTLDLMQATLYSFVFAQPLKPIIGRGRPIREHVSWQSDWDDIGPWVWGHSSFKTTSQYTSFPSFHATFYSAFCTVLMDYLGYRWSGPILGAFFFFQEPSHFHWLSDIIGGGLFGYWLASSILDTPEQKENNSKSKTSLLISPYNGGVAVNLTYEF